MKHNRTTTYAGDTPEQLLETLRQLVSETEQLVADAGDRASEKIEDLRSRIDTAGESLRELYGTARQRIIMGARRTNEVIRAHPYESLVVTLGLGVLLGALLRRSK